MEWQPVRGGILEADVMRWMEPIWPPNRRRSTRRASIGTHRRPWGKQEVTGQVTAMDGEYVSLKIIKAEIKESNVGADLRPHKVGTIIRKKRSTLQKGEVKRLPWSDESARDAVDPPKSINSKNLRPAPGNRRGLQLFYPQR